MGVKEEAKCECGEERVEWIYTYGDMVTLVLCFFVLLFALSSTSEQKFNAVSASFRGGPPASPYMFTGAPSPLENLTSEIRTAALAETTDITIDDRGIAVSFSDSAVFEPGSTKLSAKGLDTIEKFARLLYAVPNRIIIEGHTDNVPIRTPLFPSNWELSGARAGSVARAFNELGIEANRMETAGFGETRPKVSNDSPELRAINRRIDILIKPEGY